MCTTSVAQPLLRDSEASERYGPPSLDTGLHIIVKVDRQRRRLW